MLPNLIQLVKTQNATQKPVSFPNKYIDSEPTTFYVQTSLTCIFCTYDQYTHIAYIV